MLTFTGACTSRFRACTIRKGPPMPRGNLDLHAHRQHIRTHIHAKGEILYGRCQIDLVYLNRYPVPLLLEIRERKRDRERGRRVPWIPPWIFHRQVTARKGVYSRHDNSLRNWIEWALSFALHRPPPSEAFDSNVYACECSDTRVHGLREPRGELRFRDGLRTGRDPGSRCLVGKLCAKVRFLKISMKTTPLNWNLLENILSICVQI